MHVAELKNVRRELHYFQVRLGVAGALVLAAFAVLFGRFFYLQVIQRPPRRATSRFHARCPG